MASEKSACLSFDKRPELWDLAVEALAQDIHNFFLSGPEHRRFDEIRADMQEPTKDVTAIEALLYGSPEYSPPHTVQIDPENLRSSKHHHYFTERWLQTALECAETEPEVFDLVAEIGADHLLTDGPIPTNLAVFLASIITGLTKRPKRASRSKTDHQMRDFLIIGLINEIRSHFDVGLTKGPTSVSYSACDLLKAAFAKAGRDEVTASAIRQVWNKREESGRLDQLRDFMHFSALLEQQRTEAK